MILREQTTTMHSSHIYLFDHYRMDCKNWTLYRGDDVLELPPRMIDVLIHLLENSGNVVSHEELMQSVWPGLVVDHGTLKHAISVIRSRLGDEQPYRYIDTVKGRGYRFIGHVTADENVNAARTTVHTLPSSQHALSSANDNSFKAGAVAILVAIITATALIGVCRLPYFGQLRFSAVQITTHSSAIPIAAVALSPGGNKLAFADKSGLYVSDPRGVERHPVPLPEGVVPTDVQWFPDDFHLLLTAADADSPASTLWKITIVGGEYRKLLTDVSLAAPSPDGTQISFIRNDDELWIADGDGNNARLLIKYENGLVFSLGTRITPDGKAVAANLFDRSTTKSRIELVNIRDGSSSTLFAADYDIIDFVLLDNGELLISKLPQFWMTETELVAVKPAGRARASHAISYRVMQWPGAESFSLNATRDNSAVALINMKMSSRMLVAEMGDDNKEMVNVRGIENPAYDSAPAVWLADNRTLVFVSSNGGRHSINAQALDSTRVRELVSDEHDNRYPVVTADQRWLFYFSSDMDRGPRDSTTRLMKKPLAGGAAVLVDTRNDALWRLRCAMAASRCVLAENQNDVTTFVDFDAERGRGTELHRVKWNEEGTMYDWDLSPDGSAIAYIESGHAQTDIHVITLRDHPATNTMVSVRNVDPLRSIRWDAHASGFFVSTGNASSDALSILHVTLDGAYKILRREINSGMATVSITADGKHVAFRRWEPNNNIWMLRREL